MFLNTLFWCDAHAFPIELRLFNMGPLTQWGRDTMTAILKRTFSNSFSYGMIVFWKLIFHWNSFPRVPLTKHNPSLIQISKGLEANRLQAITRNNDGLVYWNICITRPWWVNFILTTLYNLEMNIHNTCKNWTCLWRPTFWWPSARLQ